MVQVIKHTMKAPGSKQLVERLQLVSFKSNQERMMLVPLSIVSQIWGLPNSQTETR